MLPTSPGLEMEQSNMAERTHFSRDLLERPGALVLTVLGTAMAAFAMVMFAITGNVAAVTFAILGLTAIIFGTLLPRLEEAEFSVKGAKMKLSPATEASVHLAELTGDVSVEMLDEPEEMVVASRNYLAGEALAAILRANEEEGLVSCHLRLYLYDDDRDRLVPVFVPGEEAGSPKGQEDAWEVGRGATGTAYKEGQFVHVTGPAIWDETYGVTPEQAEGFRNLTAVASMPVTNSAGNTIGVITALTDAPDGGGLATEEAAFHALLARSLLAARVLVDLLGWFSDR